MYFFAIFPVFFGQADDDGKAPLVFVETPDFPTAHRASHEVVDLVEVDPVSRETPVVHADASQVGEERPLSVARGDGKEILLGVGIGPKKGIRRMG